MDNKRGAMLTIHPFEWGSFVATKPGEENLVHVGQDAQREGDVGGAAVGDGVGGGDCECGGVGSWRKQGGIRIDGEEISGAALRH